MDTDIDRFKDLLQEFDLYNYGILLVSVRLLSLPLMLELKSEGQAVRGERWI